MKNEQNLNNVTRDNSIKWLRFYKGPRFIISFILIPLQAFGCFLTYFTGQNEIGAFLNIFVGLLDLCLLALAIATYKKLQNMSSSGYALNIKLLFAEAVTVAAFPAVAAIRPGVTQASLYNTSYNAGATAASCFFVILIINCLLWVLPNYIYFKKRRSLFFDKD